MSVTEPNEEFSQSSVELRAGDSDRERINRKLTDAFSQGQLDLNEYQERSRLALNSRYLRELDDLIGDLNPSVTADRAPVPQVATHSRVSEPGVGLSVGFMGGSSRAGAWTTAAGHTALALMGGVELDLREASFNAAESSIFAVAIMGGVAIVVPPGVRVRIHGLPIMGGFGAEGPAINPSDLPPDAPTVTISGFALWGGVSVQRKDYGE